MYKITLHTRICVYLIRAATDPNPVQQPYNVISITEALGVMWNPLGKTAILIHKIYNTTKETQSWLIIKNSTEEDTRM